MSTELKVSVIAVVLSLLSCGNVHADYGYSDSLVFSLNLLSNHGAPSFGCSDSPSFALNLLFNRASPSFNCNNSNSFNLNLLNIRRASADSENFAFDWLANTAAQIGPYRLPALPSVDNKLLFLDSSGNWITPVAPPPYGATVIIINHGWNGGPLEEDFLEVAHQIAARVPNAYIYTWHWGDGQNTKSQANPNGLPTESDFAPLLDCGLACLSCSSMCAVASKDFMNEVQTTFSNAGKNGWSLGNFLYSFGIKPDSPYNHKIHMIGHSFGGVVSANAAFILSAKTHTKIKQLTTIETPALYFDARIYIEPTSADRVEVLYYTGIDAVGGPLETNANNVLNLELNPIYQFPNSPLILHLKAFDGWYKNTIGENILNCENKPFGFGWSVSLNPSNPEWSQDFPLGNKKETALGMGCLSYIEGAKNIATKVADKVKDTFSSATTWVGEKSTMVWDAIGVSAVSLTTGLIHNQNLVLEKGLSEYQKSGFGTLDEGTDPNVAYIYKVIDVPPDAQQLLFDYRFISYNPGDTLSLSIDNNTPLVIDADVEGISQSYKTSFPVYVGDYGGRTVTLQISLRSTGATSAQVYINNLRFTAVTLTEDINGDKTIDYADLSVLAQNWLTVGCNFRNNCDGADINGDNKVDFADFARLATYWLESF